MRIIFGIMLMSLWVNCLLAQDKFKKPQNKVLVVSGGGARGAWGVGLLSELYEKNNGKSANGYKAIFGTSTGSLMAPFLLLQKNHALEIAYSNVEQGSIFSSNPFKVTYDPETKTVTTKIRTFKMILRMILGKKTLGETKNLRKLIGTLFTQARFDSLLDLYATNKMVLAVAVTNTRTGDIEIKSDSVYAERKMKMQAEGKVYNSKSDYEEMCDWIWASANEPLFMSYVKMRDKSYTAPRDKPQDSVKYSYYVDGGLREVVPIQEALKFAVYHNIDSVDVVINNSKIPESQNWDLMAGGIMNGLERILAIYNMGTVEYNENYSELLAKYFDVTKNLPPPLIPITSTTGETAVEETKSDVTLTFYWMPDDVAAKYPNELGFIKEAMQTLIAEGKNEANGRNELKGKTHKKRFSLKRSAIRSWKRVN